MAEQNPPDEARPSVSTPAVAEPTGTGGDWARKYPPLVTILVALLLAIAVLPSALNLPQTNPTQTLEYAPVPPEDSDEPPPADGNLSSLGLGSSPGVAEDAEGGDGAGGGDVPGLPGGKGVNPSTKKCVGNPPRQTEDPSSPPCVAYFDGDNFGATYQGVTREEIRLLIYIDGNVAETGGSRGQESRPENTFFDLFEPPEEGEREHVQVEAYRAWQRYFNERYQTYGRLAHFFLHFGNRSSSPEARRADASEGYARVKPFAVLTDALGNELDYVEEMARRGVLNFGSFNSKEESFFRRFPKLVWGYQPSIELAARTYSSYVCKKVVGHPTVLSGNPGQNGTPRKFGILHTTDENYPGLIRLAELVEEQIAQCGAQIEMRATFPTCCYAMRNDESPDDAAANMSEFQSAGITTILWPGGIEGHHGRAAAAQNYYPEWLVLGDGTLDTNHPVRLSSNSAAFDGHAIAVSAEPYEPGIEQQLCYQALREAGASRPKPDMHWMCEPYRNLTQLFTGIQVAGPRLGPSSVDKGYHAIPPVRSDNPQVPACFYNENDYTCVKDTQAVIWDADGEAPGDNRPGCWRSIQGGKRYLTGEHPPGNIDAHITGQEPCTGRSVAVVYWPYPV
ncbi:MAG: hypothetical protein KY395_06965 [Actinobacteria bacterium]|nr:hypothetical protein [Actinomycetota bacterium]